MDITVYEKDCKRISELTGGKIAEIRILGGEPLLHPNVAAFLEITRKYFPFMDASKGTGVIELVTNGILLPKQKEQFWKTCKDNNIRIFISEYPISIDKEYIKAQSEKYGVQIKMHEGVKKQTGSSFQQWIKTPIDLEGKQNNKNSFGKCFLGGTCFQLVDGKIYKCARIAYIKLFNEKFNKNLIVSEGDYIDIYKAHNIDEILEALTEPAPFCRYCKVEEMTWTNEWRITTKEISEWV
ncbi:hypothetical protein FACS1894199_03650 [Bacteroidia bacterium]|nr:hypothetical protein FACS1894199_03650 [Bacteroidia bacterium]